MGDRYLKQPGGGVRRSDAMDAAADGMAILSDDEYVYVNEAYVGLHGYDEPEALLGKTWYDVYEDDEVERLEDEVFPAVHEEGDWRGEVTGLRADGSEFTQEVTFTRMEDGGIVCVVRDVTERKERQKELERYEAFIEKSTDIITHLDEDGTVMYQSPSVEEVFGYEHGETVGDNAFEYVHPDDREQMMERFASALENPETRMKSTEFRVRDADGDYVWIEDAGGTLVNAEVDGLVLNLREITERKEREKELERYEAFIENSSDSITHLDEEGNILYRSPANEREEDEPDDMAGTYAFDHIHPEDREHALEKFRSLLNDPDKTTDSVEYRSERADGTYDWVEAIATDQRDTEVGGIIVNTRVINDRKEREKELERYETFVENSSDIVVHLDEDGTIIYQSPSVEHILGNGQDERIGDYAFEYLHPEDRERVFELFESVTDGDRETAVGEFRAENTDGGYVWFEARARRETELDGLVVNARDISERKEREKELERYEAFIEHSSDIITHLSEDGTILYQSPSIERVLGYGQNETVGDRVFDYVHPDDREEVLDVFYTVAEDIDREVEFRLRNADDDYVWVEATGSDHTETETGGFIVNTRDISERKERERELERYEAFVESSSDVITHVDGDGTIMYNSPSIEEVFGYGQYETVGDNAFEYVHPDDREQMMELFAASLEGTNTREENAEFRILNADGEYVWVEDAAGNQSHPKIDGDVLNLRDITERKERERELREEKNRHRALVDSFPNGAVFLFDEDLRFSIAGGTELDNVELSPEDIEGRTIHEVFSEETVEKHEPYYRKALEGKEACFENTYDGNVYRVWTVPVRDDDGEIFSGIAFSQNITERKEREKELERYEAIVKNTSDIVTLIDEDGTMLYQSPSVENVMGYGQHERVGESGFEYVHPEDRERAIEAFEKVVNDPETDMVEVELRFRRADGEYIWFDIRGTDQRDTDVDAFVINARDISERKERDEELRRNREILGHTERIANTGGWEYEVEDDVLRWTEGTYKVHDLPTDSELTLEGIAELYHPDDREALEQAVDNCIKHGEPYEEVVRLVNGDDVRWIRTSGEPVREEGWTVKVRGAVQDVTERKERERELERYEALIKNSLDIFAVLNETGEYVYNSPSVERILGYSPEEHTGEYSLDYVHPDDRGEAIEWFYSITQGDAVISETELRYRHADGSYVWFEIIGSDQRDTEVGGIVFNARDISERKEREKELERYEAFIENSSDIITHIDDDGNVLYQSPATERIMGRDPSERVGKSALEHVHPDDKDNLVEKLDTLMSDNETDKIEVEFRSKREDGEYIWLDTIGTDQRDTEYGGIIVNSRDITERKKNKQELERNRELLGHAERISDTGGWELNVETGELRWTNGTHEIHEVSGDYEPTVEEAIEFYHAEDRDEIRRAVEMCSEEGVPFDRELRLVTAEDRLRWCRSRGEPVTEDDEIVKLRGAIQDITDRKERERELRERKDQIDFFNSLLRHDMLNSMTVISGSVDILLDELPEGDDRRELAERIDKHSTGIVELTERVRSVLRRLTENGSTEMAPVDVSDVVKERVEELEETYEVSCSLEVPDDVRVEADLFLDHVIDNLLVNAVEHNDKDLPRVEVTVEEDEENVTVRVADNGPGIPDDEKETVFEQGTTGRTSGGVGFGLYYVDAMISEYGGEVTVEDGESEGAVFVVELPKAVADTSEAGEWRDGEQESDKKEADTETDLETDENGDATETDKWGGKDTEVGGG